MVQRSTTYVMTSKNGIEVLLGGLYNEGGVSLSSSSFHAAYYYSVDLCLTIPDPY